MRARARVIAEVGEWSCEQKYERLEKKMKKSGTKKGYEQHMEGGKQSFLSTHAIFMREKYV